MTTSIRLALITCLAIVLHAARVDAIPVTVAEFRWESSLIPGTECTDPDDLECVPTDAIAQSLFSLTGLWDDASTTAPTLSGVVTFAGGGVIPLLDIGFDTGYFDQFVVDGLPPSVATMIFFGALASCTGGGGGGGGGGLLVVANGTLTMVNYDFQAEGGTGGAAGNGSCANGGGGGSGGAIRVVASRLIDGGAGRLLVRGSSGGTNSQSGADGRIRLESLDASAQTAFTPFPVALRVTGPSPVVNPLSPTVRITSVGGQLPPAVPQGGYGAIDVVLPAPGVTGIDVATSGVPSGTTVLVTVKPRIGGAALSATVPLDACNAAGDCTATTAFNLAAGAYFVEARATFQVQ